MKAEELRIGSIVQYGSELCKIIEIDSRLNIFVLKSELGIIYTTNSNALRFVRLNEDLVLRLYFIKSHGGLLFLSIPKIEAEIHYEMHNYGNVITIQSDFGMIIPDDIDYVHRLQNLYFALTNEELTFIE